MFKKRKDEEMTQDYLTNVQRELRYACSQDAVDHTIFTNTNDFIERYSECILELEELIKFMNYCRMKISEYPTTVTDVILEQISYQQRHWEETKWLVPLMINLEDVCNYIDASSFR